MIRRGGNCYRLAGQIREWILSRIWMPLYVSDYLGDTGHLSTIEHGAYLLLIMHYWQAGSLPDDDGKLSRICRMPLSEWMEIRSTIAEFFEEAWRHGRIEAELSKADEIVRKRRAAGKAGASARYGKSYSKCHGKRSDLPKQTHSQSQPQSQSPTQEDLEKDISSDFDSEFPAWYEIYPRHEGKGAALRAYRAARKKADAETLLDGAKVAAERYRDSEKRFTPMPATWLNGERWLDDPGASSADPKKPLTGLAAIDEEYRRMGIKY